MILRSDPYVHETSVKHRISVLTDRLTSGVLAHLANSLLDQCGNDVTLDVTIVESVGAEGSPRELRIEART